LALIGNIIWFVFGGLVMGLAWWLAGILCFISIIGIPWGKACFVIGQFTFWPFGKEAVSRKHKSGKDDIGTGMLGLIGNVFWLIFMGIWLAIGHIVSGILCCITIIGIPFGIQHFKLVPISLMPIGMIVVDK
jgi:uncharacterized membrane protein YccF (DUF307 family)